MSLTRAMQNSLVTVGALFAAVAMGACGAAPTGESTATSNDELVITKCPTGYTGTTDCEPGIGGKMICSTSCDIPTRPYSSGIATPGTATMVDGAASTYLWNNGCSTSATIYGGDATPYFTCPSTFAPTQLTGWFGALQPCVTDGEGKPYPPKGYDVCEEIFWATDLTQAPNWTHREPSSVIGTLKSGYEYLWILEVTSSSDIYTLGCGAVCSMRTHFP